MQPALDGSKWNLQGLGNLCVTHLLEVTQQEDLPVVRWKAIHDLLDAILERYVGEGRSAGEIIGDGFDREIVRDIIRKVDRNEYKRKQAAPGLKITPLAFGSGRRMPIVQRFDADRA